MTFDEEWSVRTTTVSDVLCSACDDFTVIDAPEWTPCAVKQPKKAGRYLITFANVNPEYKGPMVDIAIWDGTVWSRPAAAWMPVPDYWKGDE